MQTQDIPMADVIKEWKQLLNDMMEEMQTANEERKAELVPEIQYFTQLLKKAGATAASGSIPAVTEAPEMIRVAMMNPVTETMEMAVVERGMVATALTWKELPVLPEAPTEDELFDFLAALANNFQYWKETEENEHVKAIQSEALLAAVRPIFRAQDRMHQFPFNPYP